MDAEPRASALPNAALAPSDPDRSTILLRLPAPRVSEEPVSPPVSVRFMDTEHLRFVVGEQRRLFPDGFFSRLGPGFLTAHTRTYLTSPHAVGFVAEVDGAPVGYLVGVVDPALHRRHLLRAHGPGLAVRAAAALAVRPALAVNFLRTRLPRYARKLLPGRRAGASASAAPAPPAVHDREAVLAHVAVCEEARSYGIGGQLMERFADFAVVAGCTRVSLVTAAGPAGAGPYYERRGWERRAETHTPDGKHLLVYARPLGAHRPDPI
ncbi:GNAT family N-acetyltransferase [Streptomyces sp. NPDC051243]|uniref:GNAT family N-acetyltransferase n=1 Tax=Streptomyces sp. NPDC051243 TaxID=3365646 RepID=UPI0037B24BEF